MPAWNTYIWVESTDDTAETVKSAGGRVVVEPFDVLPAGRMVVLADPAGASFCAWEARDRKGAQLVNEPSAWSMSALNTRDPEAAKEFYGAVFGWTTDTFDVGDAEITMWRVPGYEGGEPEQPVSREVVGTMAPMTDDSLPPDVSPHWSIDFWVDDVDATAEGTTELGGTVIVTPYDLPIPGMRQAVLADPQGAAFSVSKVGPPAWPGDSRYHREGANSMSKVVVNNTLTLDGVMQAPGRPDEDPRGGFEHGGWALLEGDAAEAVATLWNRGAVYSPTAAHSPLSDWSTRSRPPPES